MKELWTSVGFLMAVFAFAQSIVRSFLPPEFRFSPDKLSRWLFRNFSSYCYYDIAELSGVSPNGLYDAIQLHLSNSASVFGTRLSLTRPPNSSTFTFNLSNNDYLHDTFKGAAVSWEHRVTQRQSQSFSWRPVSDEKRTFTLKINKKDKPVVIPAYFDYIMDSAVELRRKNKDRFLYTNSRGGGSMDSHGRGWDSVPFKHPSTFETLAMDPAVKDEIIADLREFSEGKAFYERTGRAWKRGYFLHGPPGTGKSSMIAAMANHLGYDIYDLELTEVQTNSELRKLLMKTTAKSIIVIEDIDCSLELTNKRSGNKKEKPAPEPKSTASGEEGQVRSVTLSGLLNFTDGIWSCCGSERIFVFTTNHAEKLDPALLRSGRMDMHILMGCCSFPALKILIKNYLGEREEEEEEEEEKRAWVELEEVIVQAEITPADVSEVLIKNRRRGRRLAMEELVKVLKGRVEERKMAPGRKVEGGEEAVEEVKRTLESPTDGGDGGTELMTVDEGPDEVKEGKELAV